MATSGTTNYSPRPQESCDSPVVLFRRAWRAGSEPNLHDFVGGHPNVCPAELAALVRVDFEARWSRNDRRRPEEYLQSFSAIAADAELAVDVIYAEYLAREQHGEQPELVEYQKRFPEFASILTAQIRLHDALNSVEDESPLELSDDDLGHRPTSNPRLAVYPAKINYEILEQIGTGGMSIVYRARQSALNRDVALKMVRAIDADNPELLFRFRTEARVVAALRHPYIVQVHDFGEHDGLPYIAMEFIQGGTLADRLNGNPWLPRAAAELLIKLAGAIAFAHQHNIIHRDLKPANILVVSEADGLDVKVTDFGLAKFQFDESSIHTKSYSFLGTPSYMAPEQAGGSPCDVGPSADIYALGAILYELLTGVPPFRGESPIETLRLLLTKEPVPVQQIAPQVPSDLATICDTCLQHDPERRYSTATLLGADLERFLAGKPIEARPISSVERLSRWCCRNPLLTAAISAVALLLIGITAVSFWYSAKLSRELARTRMVEQSERNANQTGQQRLWELYLSEASARNASRRAGQQYAALQAIDKAIALLDTVGRTSQREVQLRSAVLTSVVLPDIRQLRSLGKLPPAGHICDASVPAGLYLVASADGTFIGHRLSDGLRLWEIKANDAQATPLLSPDGRFVAISREEGTKVWSVEDSTPQLIWEVDHAEHFSLLADGKHAVYSLPSAGMRVAQVRDGTFPRAVGKGTACSKFVYHADTNRLAVCGSTSIQIISLSSGEVEAELPREAFEGAILAWHPSGNYLAIWAANKGVITLWNVKSRSKVLSLPHLGLPSQLCFNEDGTLLTSQSLWDQRLCVWDVGTGRRLMEMPEFVSVACGDSTGRRILLVTTKDGAASLMELSAGACRALPQALHPPLAYWNNVSLSPESRIAAFSSVKGFELWDLRTMNRLLVREAAQCKAQFDRDGGLFVGCDTGLYYFSRHVETNLGSNITTDNPQPHTVVRFADPVQLSGPIVSCTLGVSSSGATLVYCDRTGWALQHRGIDQKIIRLQTELDPRLSAVSGDNRFAAIANWDYGGASVWNAQTGQHLANLPVGTHGILQFSPDGRFLAATPNGVTLWNTTDWQRSRELQAHGTTLTGLAIAFSADSSVLAVGQITGELGLIDPITGNEWARLPLSDLGAGTIAFSPDQQWLLASSINERSPAQLWDLPAIRHELRVRNLDLPADVLRSTNAQQNFEATIQIIIEDAGIF